MTCCIYFQTPDSHSESPLELNTFIHKIYLPFSIVATITDVPYFSPLCPLPPSPRPPNLAFTKLLSVSVIFFSLSYLAAVLWVLPTNVLSYPFPDSLAGSNKEAFPGTILVCAWLPVLLGWRLLSTRLRYFQQEISGITQPSHISMSQIPRKSTLFL